MTHQRLLVIHEWQIGALIRCLMHAKRRKKDLEERVKKAADLLRDFILITPDGPKRASLSVEKLRNILGVR